MTAFALDPLWNDIYTAGGFWIGVTGLAGLILTVWQVRETKRAAVAAREAADRTLAGSKDAYKRFIGGFASRLLSELRQAVSADNWAVAELRAHDLAEVLATLPESEPILRSEVDRLRDSGHLFAELRAGRTRRPSRTKHQELFAAIQTRVDALRTPFPNEATHERGDDTAGRNAQGDRPEPPRPVEGGAGELGENPR